jgi:hypothetical protein
VFVFPPFLSALAEEDEVHGIAARPSATTAATTAATTVITTASAAKAAAAVGRGFSSAATGSPAVLWPRWIEITLT